MRLKSIFSKKSKEMIEEIQPIKVMDNGAVRYPETQKLLSASRDMLGDFDRRPDGQIMNYLGSLGYIDHDEEAECGIPRLRVVCEYCGGKTDFHYYNIFCWFGKEIRTTSYYNCRRCGKKTSIEDKDANKFERGFWN